jgi:[glutamine synthetase] adenylyltransferase / [glutamine synthetase]-adenylyl-L-tyrosine phosphorylase
VPRFAEKAIDGGNPDEALLQLVDFSRLLAARESYLDSIVQRPEIIDNFNFVFSHSDYLSKVLMSNPEYMESLAEITIKAKSLETTLKELELLIERKGESAAIRIFRRLEEIRLGMLLLNREIGAIDLMRGISTVAEAVFCSLQAHHPTRLAVAALGKLGGREIIFNSDLDIVFITHYSPEVSDVRDAENLIKLLMSYTKDGVAYKVDTRLRPDGSKGSLVSSISGITDYYIKNAQPWELQALLKARIVSGERAVVRAFIRMRRMVLQKRAAEITIHDIRNMRERIRRELSRDAIASGHHDIKLGNGGLEELEFAVQYLQLRNCARFPNVAAQGTLDAISRLGRTGVIAEKQTVALKETYVLYRTLETVLRLRSETLLKEGSGTAQSAARLTGHNEEELFRLLKQKRAEVAGFMESLAS